MLLPFLFTWLGLSLAHPFTECPGGYKNGEKIKAGQFIKLCTITPKTMSITMAGCISNKGTEIPLGSKLEENKLIFNCISTEGGGARMETNPAPSKPAPPKENMKCNDKYTNGQKYTEGSFVKKCSSTPSSWSTSVVACLTPSGKEIAIGASAEEGKFIYSCVQTEKGAKLEKDLAVKGCEGGKYQKDQTYLSSDKRFLLKCMDDYGSNEIVACMSDDGKELKVGAEKIDGDFKYKCVKEPNGSVKYLKEPLPTTPTTTTPTTTTKTTTTTTPIPTTTYIPTTTKPIETTTVKGCQNLAIGESIVSEDKRFRSTCVATDKMETSCIVEGGEVKADTKMTIGQWNYECKSSPRGGATLSKKRTP